MGAVIPSILERSRERIEEKLARIAGLADIVQVDVVDGRLAGAPTWPYSEGGLAALPSGFDIHEMADVRYEIDLMTEDPAAAMRAFLAAGAGKLVLHAESAPDLGGLLDELERTYGRDKEFSPDILSVGVSARITTPLSRIEPYLPRVDFVQLMGIATIGKQGVPFDERVLGKIRELKSAHPEMTVQIDGGVSLQTAPSLAAAGADRLVVGSALWNSEDLAGTIHEFERILAERVR